MATCPSYYMPKQQTDVVEIAGKPSAYAHRRTSLRCTISCEGGHSTRKPSSRWSIWSSENIEDLPGPEGSDEKFEARCAAEVSSRPEDARLQSLGEQRGVNCTPNWQVYDMVVYMMMLSCSMCQLVCMPGMPKRRAPYRKLVNSGRIEPGGPRMQPPEDEGAANFYGKWLREVVKRPSS